MKTKPLLRKDRYYKVRLGQINKFTGPSTYDYPDFLSARRFARRMHKEHGIRTDIYNQYGRRIATYGAEA